MKFLLIAIYLGAPSGSLPELQTRAFTDKAECQALAERYIKQVKVGQARAFCLKRKEA